MKGCVHHLSFAAVTKENRDVKDIPTLTFLGPREGTFHAADNGTSLNGTLYFLSHHNNCARH